MMTDLFGGNLDAVVRLAIVAVRSGAQAVGQAIDLVVAAKDIATRLNASQALRMALVAQAEGHEPCAANGATYRARCDAARAALAAWDAPIEVGTILRA
jgi:hypothetical protein